MQPLSNSVPAERPEHTPQEYQAFVQLFLSGLFAQNPPKGYIGKWLDAPTSALKGVGPATARLLAAKRIGTLRELALSQVAWPREFPAAAQILANAQHMILAVCEANGVALGGTMPAPWSRTMATYINPITGERYTA